MRIHELAKKLGIDSKELLTKLQSLNFPVKSHMSSVDDETAEIIKHEITGLKEKEIEENVIEVDFPISVKDLALKLGKKPSELLSDLLKEGKFLNINQNLNEELAAQIAYKYKINLKKKPTREETILKTDSESKEIKKRAPIVTLMGHIDHGKTSLLDYIRKSKIAEKESGGITQHIGAYQVTLPKGKITFLDTPGHETFTAMRARGANITDAVILVVASDEGVKPQTEEALDHAKAANVPILIAITKMDKPNANPDMVKQQLSKLGLAPEEWGGKTTAVGVSAKTGQGIDELLELILLQAELLELKADYGRPAVGVVVEARLSKGKGPLVAILVREGVLKLGDCCVCGHYYGKIKAMSDDKANNVIEAQPSSAVEVLGLNGVPNPGDQLFVVPDEKSAKEIVERRREEDAKLKLKAPAHFKLEDLFKKIKEEHLKQLKVILKADVGGTLEAVEDALKKISHEEVELVLTHRGVGAINASDILLAEVTDAIVVGFKVTIDTQARDLAKQKGIEIRVYQIVYELIDDIKAGLEGLLTPQVKKIFVGRARVKAVFKLSKSGIIAGSIIEKGKMQRNLTCQLTRESKIIFEGKIQSLKRFKDDVREVAEGVECGIGIGFDEIKEGDIIDAYSEELIARRLK
ncbi:MAG: translation initiation factor IF-2 [Candidatus Omnitrophica bacterium]|jgi:translation initiation factor IF-2|nr:translation initiation factor IF-2 [Candidatus Omnitrophota bacterium]